MAKIKVQISGKVQGVFFRHSAREQALSLQLIGWVKNLPDSSVLCEAEGTKKSLLAFIDWCSHGPKRAVVENVAVEWLDENDCSQPPIDADFGII